MAQPERLAARDAVGGRPSAYFGDLLGGFERAAAGRAIDRFYQIGGHAVRLCFAGPALVPALTRAFDHLAIAPTPNPALTICVWDSATTATRISTPLWRDTASFDAEVNAAVNEDAKPAVYFKDARVHGLLQLGHDTVSMFEPSAKQAVFWAPGPENIPYYEVAGPLRAILHWWVQGQGRQLVHAGAVGTSTGGALLVGKGGSGKSTTTLACLGSELHYLGDNDVLIAIDPAPHAYSLYNCAKLDVRHLQMRLPHLSPLLRDSAGLYRDKGLLFLHDRYRDQLATAFPLHVILLPRVTGTLHTCARRVSAAAGLTALAPSSIFQLPSARREKLRQLGELVRRVPSYALDLGTDLGEVRDVVAQVLAENR
jgi:hypothetical protein